jgi:hypothetical protein
MLADGRIVARAGFDRVFGKGERRDTVPVMLLAPAGGIFDTIAVLRGEEQFFVSTPQFASRRPVGFGRDMHVAVGAERIAVGSSDDYDVSVFDATGRLATRIRSTRPSLPVTAAEMDQWRTALEGGHPPFIDAATWRSLMAQIPARETHPAFSALAIDSRQHIWVAEPRTSTESGLEWTVFASTGEPAATLVTPSGFELIEIGDDYVLGRFRDEEGVERIDLYELRRG